MKPYIIYRFFFWVFLISGTLLFWLRVLLFTSWVWFLFTALCMVCVVVAYLLMRVSLADEEEEEEGQWPIS